MVLQMVIKIQFVETVVLKLQIVQVLDQFLKVLLLDHILNIVHKLLVILMVIPMLLKQLQQIAEIYTIQSQILVYLDGVTLQMLHMEVVLVELMFIPFKQLKKLQVILHLLWSNSLMVMYGVMKILHIILLSEEEVEQVLEIKLFHNISGLLLVMHRLGLSKLQFILILPILILIL